LATLATEQVLTHDAKHPTKGKPDDLDHYPRHALTYCPHNTLAKLASDRA